MQHTIWLPHGSRLDSAFAASDSAIASLRGFISAVAASLAQRQSLASAARSALRQHPHAASAFDLHASDALIEDHFALGDRLTFPDELVPATFSFERMDTTTSLALNPLLARDMRALLGLCGPGRSTLREVRKQLDEPLDTLLDTLLEQGVIVEAPPPPALRWPHGPGVARLQHAGLLYRGRDVGVLVDPHLHSAYEPTALTSNILRTQLEGLVDAIVISHSHRDHWHLPTLMSFPLDTPIIVPSVPRQTLLCPDLASSLSALGFTRVITLGWYEPPVIVGDLEIHALPFYGEQPLLAEPPRHPDLRNHGNTYLVRHETFSSWLLVDSGNDWLGRMAEVAERVHARFGDIDLLISNVREFAIVSPLYICGGHYWLALSPDQMRRFAAMKDDLITLGPHGLAEVCRIARARKVMPYAHWWGELGALPDSEERVLGAQLVASLRTLGATTELVPWHIGDCLLPAADGRHELVPLGAAD